MCAEGARQMPNLSGKWTEMRMLIYAEQSLWTALFCFRGIKKEVNTMYGKPIDSIGFVSNFDPELAHMMDREFSRQKDGLE